MWKRVKTLRDIAPLNAVQRAARRFRSQVGTSRCDVPARAAAGGTNVEARQTLRDIAPLNAVQRAARRFRSQVGTSRCDVPARAAAGGTNVEAHQTLCGICTAKCGSARSTSARTPDVAHPRNKQKANLQHAQ